MPHSKRLCRLSTRAQTKHRGNYNSRRAYSQARKRRQLQKAGRKAARR